MTMSSLKKQGFVSMPSPQYLSERYHIDHHQNPIPLLYSIEQYQISAKWGTTQHQHHCTFSIDSAQKWKIDQRTGL